MGGKDEQFAGSASTSSGKLQHHQRQQSSSSKQIPLQAAGQLRAVTTHNPPSTPIADRTKALTTGVAGPEVTRPSTGVRKASSAGNRQYLSRDGADPQGKRIGSPRNLATSLDNFVPTRQIPQHSAGAIGAQRAGSAKPQTISSAKIGQTLTRRKAAESQSTHAGGSQVYPAALAQQVNPGPGIHMWLTARRKADRSIDADGSQFAPESIADEIPRPCLSAARWPQFRHKAFNFGIGIETEFLLECRRRPSRSVTRVSDFGKLVANDHNIQVPAKFPRMYSYMEAQEIFEVDPRPRDHDEWSLTYDGTMRTLAEPWGIEMKSPIFVAFPGSPWRSRLLETWRYLQNNYEITGNERCGTHIHISVEGGYGLEELQRIATCALYFEPAFDALVPLHRTGGRCQYAQNLWLDGIHLAIDNRSRLECGKLINSLEDFDSFLDILNPESNWFSWNFRSIEKFYTVEFRKPPACKTADEVLAWAEITLAFTQSSIRYGTLDIIKKIPSTVGGLRSFLERSHVDGLNEHARFETIFRGKNPKSFVQSKPWDSLWWTTEQAWAKFERKKSADSKRIQELKRTRREP